MNDDKRGAVTVSSSNGSDARDYRGRDALLLSDDSTDSRGAVEGDAGACGNAPTCGKYVGAGYIVGGIVEHEAQSSGLAARAGGVMLDYVRATLPADAEVWAELCEWLGAMQERPIGWRGWYDKSAVVLDGGLVAWCSRGEVAARQGVLVDLPGKACACLGERLIPFLAWCCERGRVRRVDFALDDRRGLLTYERLWAAVRSGACLSRAREVHGLEGAEASSGERRGWTLYVGSRSSQAVIRLYDKAAEQHTEGAWVRCELEAKSDFADALARAVLAESVDVVLEQLNRRLRFAVPTGDGNRGRWPVAPWWAEFIGSLERGAPLTCGEPQEATLARMREYVRRQAGPALAALMLADGGDLSWLSEVFADGERRLQPKHRAALALAGVDVGAAITGITEGCSIGELAI
jgi:phage replication initiation protein